MLSGCGQKQPVGLSATGAIRHANVSCLREIFVQDQQIAHEPANQQARRGRKPMVRRQHQLGPMTAGSEGQSAESPCHLLFGGVVDLLGLRDELFPGVVLLSRRR